MSKKEPISYSPDMFGPIPRKGAGLLQWFWFFVRPEGWQFFFLSLNRMWRSAVFSLQPFIIGVIVDAVESGRAVADPTIIWKWLLIYAAVLSVVYLLLFVSMLEGRHLDRTQWRAKLFCVDHLMRLSLDRHEHSGTGASMQRIGRACSSLTNLMNINFTVGNIIFGSFIGIIISIICLKVPFYFVFLFLGFILTFALTAVWIRRNIHVHLTRLNRTVENLSRKIYDYVSSIRTVKNFDLADFVKTRAVEGESASYHARKPVIRINYTMWVVLSFVGLFWFVVIISTAFNGVLQGAVTIGAFASMAAITYQLWSQISGIAIVLERFSENKNGLMRISKLLWTPVEQVDDIENPADFPKQWSQIEVRDLSFHYRPSLPVLSNVKMSFPRNKRIALIGRSGSGKSTLAKLLMKQIVPVSGQILFDNVELSAIPRSQVLRNIALVPQDVELFNGSVRENIFVNQADLDESVYQDCIHRSYMSELIKTLPAGDKTQIGERGMRLSGGQRQRLGIARALARQSNIIIFDEATSSLDSESEDFIQRALESSFDDKTLIVIAHRLSTIKSADLIYVLEDGAIAESGDFNSLISQDGIFKKLWSMQSEGFVSV